jgi:hypothetical protein
VYASDTDKQGPNVDDIQLVAGANFGHHTYATDETPIPSIPLQIATDPGYVEKGTLFCHPGLWMASTLSAVGGPSRDECAEHERDEPNRHSIFSVSLCQMLRSVDFPMFGLFASRVPPSGNSLRRGPLESSQ